MTNVVYGPSADAKMAMVKCADYVIRHAQRISREFGIELVLVIDGDDLPCKQAVNAKRREDRAAAYQKGLQFERRGDLQEARKQFAKACSISHEVRRELVLQCQAKQIRFLVAPYEADAQLAYLSHRGIVDAVISEDSDLLAYGCPRVLFKLDMKTGKGDEIQIMKDLASNTPLSFQNWNHDMFVLMCILAGCDYFEGVPGIGIQTAYKLVRVHRTPYKIFEALRMGAKLPRGFEEAFCVAYRTFRHQRVYCTTEQIVRPLFPIQVQLSPNEEWNFIGPAIEKSLAISIATGVIHPRKHVSWKEIEEKRVPYEAKRVPYVTVTGNHHRNPPIVTDKKTATRKKSTSEMFACFKRGSKGKSQAVQNRGPLAEVSSNQNKSSQQGAARSSANAYKSNLVGSPFKTLPRNFVGRISRGPSDALLNFRKMCADYKNKSLPQIMMERKQRKAKLQAALDKIGLGSSMAPSHQGNGESGGLDFIKNKRVEPSNTSSGAPLHQGNGESGGLDRFKIDPSYTYSYEANCSRPEYDYLSSTGAGLYGSCDYGLPPDINVDEELLNFNNLSFEDNDFGGTSKQHTLNTCQYEEEAVGMFQGSHDNIIHQGIWDNRIDEQYVSAQHNNLPIISSSQEKNNQYYQGVNEHSYQVKGSNKLGTHPYHNRYDSNRLHECGDNIQGIGDQTYARESQGHDLNNFSYGYGSYPKESSQLRFRRHNDQHGNIQESNQLRFRRHNDKHDHREDASQLRFRRHNDQHGHCQESSRLRFHRHNDQHGHSEDTLFQDAFFPDH
ncbi:hypothetical protein CTEN210_14810 [Chaetoceros tenuissimus]|uniref:XPG-I domain-containing protein n=1 Tax=Chaetoceros tenuissimus TaxID=426638 RepID=A0AAD3D963_9STRA|nr:hypothetical protein CTEN210_14810 [Chaetoceros tenuissimus]